MVQDLPATTAHPPFRQTILPWRLKTGWLGLQTGSFQKPDHVNAGNKSRVRVRGLFASPIIIASLWRRRTFESRSRITYRYGPASGRASRSC